MINWIRSKLHNFIFPPDTLASTKLSVRERDDADIEGMRFTVMPAEGGTILQMRTYNRRTDEQNTKTYVIPETEQDIAHRVGQIVALELFKI